MPAPAAPPDDFVIHHARVRGSGRRQMEAGFAAMRAADIVPQDEVLYVPRLRFCGGWASDTPPSLVAARLTDRLRRAAAEADVDPRSPGDGSRSLRFRSMAAYAAWLLAVWITETAPVSKPILRAALRDQSVEQWQRRTLLADGRTMVGVARLLARRGLLGAWVARLDERDIQQAISCIANDYGLPALAEIAGNGTRNDPPGFLLKTRVAAERASPNWPARARIAHVARLVRSDAENSVPTFASLPTSARLLVAAAVGLSGKRGAARLLGSKDWSDIVSSRPYADAGAAAIVDRPEIIGPTDPPPTATAAGNHPSVLPGRAAPVGANAFPSRPDDTLAGPPNAKPKLPHRAINAEAAEQAARAQTEVGKTELPVKASFTDPAPLSFSTEFGGVFFLLNLFLWMRLYPDFTRPRDPGLAASPFFLLARLGQRLFGRAFARDPLYAWLIENGTRAAFPRRWRPKPEWLAGMGDIMEPGLHRGGWLSQLADFAKCRLARSADGMKLDQFRLDADVMVDDERLLVRFRLAQLPLPLRLAGLDRDPGWIASEGRTVGFEFV